MLLGYYPLMTRLQPDLPEVFAAIRAAGCLTALDAAGDGGTMDPLARILPHLDFYVPNETEAAHQTGRTEPRAMIQAYRDAGAAAGSASSWASAAPCSVRGRANSSMLPWSSRRARSSIRRVPAIASTARCWPACCAVLSPADAGRLAAAAGAFCVTGLGATSAIRGYDETARLAGLR